MTKTEGTHLTKHKVGAPKYNIYLAQPMTRSTSMAQQMATLKAHLTDSGGNAKGRLTDSDGSAEG
jgi:hypothetical protein